MNDLDFGLDGPGRFSIFLQGHIDIQNPKWFLEALEQLRIQWTRPCLKRTRIEMILGAGYLEPHQFSKVVDAVVTCLFMADIVDDNEACLGKIPKLSIEYCPNLPRVSLIRFYEMET